MYVMEDINEIKERIIEAGRKAVKELIKVAEEKIITDAEDDLTADKLKNAASAKKLAIFDSFEILSRIQAEEELLNDNSPLAKQEEQDSFSGFAEKRSK